MQSLTDIAADIRKHSPGVLPESFHVDHLGRLCFIEVAIVVEDPDYASHWYTPLPEYAVEAVLRDAMIHDPSVTDIVRNNETMVVNGLGYTTYGPPDGDPQESEEFLDDDHGGSLGACYAAWKWAKGIA